MKMTSIRFLIVVGLILALTQTACNKSADQNTNATTTTSATPGQATSTVTATATPTANLNGVYLFDTDAFKATLKTSDDPMLKDMPEDVMQQTMDGLKDFKIEVSDTTATATFGETVVKGNISKTSEAGGEVKYSMTPVDEDKKTEVVTLIFKDNKLTLDPGKKESDKMFFKKSS